MINRLAASILLLALAVPCWGQAVTLPKTVEGTVGDFIQVAAATDGKEVRWFCPDAGLSVFPTQLLKDSKTAVVVAKANGAYRLYAYTAKGDVPSDPTFCLVVVGGPLPPGPGPGPGPIPPGPTPPIPVAGFKAMIVYESADLAKLPPKQLDILYAKSIRDYLAAKGVPTTDGAKRAWYIVDKDVDFSGESKVWQNALARPRTTLPWIILSTDTSGYEGPLPGTVEETLALMKKYAEGK